MTSNPDTVLAPDVAFISRQRLEPVGKTEGYWSGPPDLAVEVLSPSDSANKVNAKLADWLSFGTRQVWIVNPKDCTVTVYRSLSDTWAFTENDELEAEDILPGFRIAVERLFS